MVVVIAMVVVAIPVVVVVVVMVMVMVMVVVVVVVIVIVVVMLVTMVVVVACTQTKKKQNVSVSWLVSVLQHIYLIYPGFSFKVSVDELMMESACVCQAGDSQNYNIGCHGKCHTGTGLPWQANEVSICNQRLC